MCTVKIQIRIFAGKKNAMHVTCFPCADQESFVRGGQNSDNVFFFNFNYFLVLMRGERIPIQLKAGHHRPTAKRGMAFRWRADDGLTLNAGLVALCFSGDLDQYC